MKREFALSAPLSETSEHLNNDANPGLIVESVSTGNYRIFKDEPTGFFKHGLYSLSCAISSISTDKTQVLVKGRMHLGLLLMVISANLPLLYRTIKGGGQNLFMVGLLLAVPIVMWLIYRFHINSLVRRVKALLEE